MSDHDEPSEPERVAEGMLESSATKQPTQKFNYHFRWSNYPSNWEAVLEPMSHDCKQYAWQEEVCPTTGTPHIQGTFSLIKKQRWRELGLPKQIHQEAVRQLYDSLNYCIKKDSRKPGGVSRYFGFEPKLELQEQPLMFTVPTKPWQLDLIARLQAPLEFRKIHWYWSEKGEMKKSAFVRYYKIHYNAIMIDGGRKCDIMQLVSSTNMMVCNTIFFDIPRADKNKISYSALEALKNGLIFSPKFESACKIFNPPHIVIFSNTPPDMDPNKMSSDRWVVFQIDEI